MADAPFEHQAHNAPKPAVNRVRLRSRRTLHGDGSWSEEVSAYCPTHDRSVGLDDCFICDLCERVVPDLRGRAVAIECRALEARRAEATAVPSLGSVPAWQVMTSEVICVAEDVSEESLMGLLLRRGYSGAPVVDALGRPIGVVSKTDIVRARFEGGETEVAPVGRGARRRDADRLSPTPLPGRTVAELMTPVSLCLAEDATVGRAAAYMVYEGVHRLPVVSIEGRVVGILTMADVAHHVAAAERFVLPERGGPRRQTWPAALEPSDEAEDDHHG